LDETSPPSTFFGVLSVVSNFLATKYNNNQLYSSKKFDSTIKEEIKHKIKENKSAASNMLLANNLCSIPYVNRCGRVLVFYECLFWTCKSKFSGNYLTMSSKIIVVVTSNKELHFERLIYTAFKSLSVINL